MQHFILIILFIAFFYVGLSLIKMYWKLRQLKESWDYVHDGMITSKRVWSGRKRQNARPTVRFTVDGKTYESTSNIGQNPPVRIGKTVGVYYNPENPDEIVINTLGQRGVPFLILGFVFVCASFVLLYVLINIQFGLW